MLLARIMVNYLKRIGLTVRYYLLSLEPQEKLTLGTPNRQRLGLQIAEFGAKKFRVQGLGFRVLI